MIALAPHTSLLFEKVTQLECIKPFLLVGGTALSLQLETRQSEDLDFMRWRTNKQELTEDCNSRQRTSEKQCDYC